MHVMRREAVGLMSRILMILLSVFFLIFGIVVGILFLPPQFEDTYVYCIQRKYQQLVGRTEPAIIIVGDSSAAFGIDSELLQTLCGYPVVNLGLQGGMGTEILVNMVKGNSISGDIVVYASNEFNWILEKGTECNRTMETIEIGFDGLLEGYRYIPISAWGEMVKAFPAYACKKIDRLIAGGRKEIATGSYAITSFDEKGNMILERGEWNMPDYTFDEAWVCNLETYNISDTCMIQLNTFYKELKEKNVCFLISYGPIMDTCVESTDLDGFEEELRERLEPKVISNIEDYIYSIDYFYNSPFHCNELGSERRTRNLATDINLYLKGENK